MHSLETIPRLNAEAFGPAIKNLTAQGRWVVATSAGLHIHTIESFSTEDEAFALMHAELSSPDINRHLYPPTTPPKTLADYIGRVQATEGVASTRTGEDGALLAVAVDGEGSTTD